MGEYADYVIDRMIWGNYSHKKPRKRGFESGSGNYNWRKSDGSVIRMQDMSDDHIKNAIRICESKGNTGKEQQLREVLAKREDKLKNLVNK